MLGGEIEKFKTTLIPALTLASQTSPGGPCVPGGKRLLVDVDGNFFPCERVNEGSPIMKIGNLYDGLYLEKCKELLNICQLNEEDCKNCWALRHCTVCARVCDNNGILSSELKKSICDSVRYDAESKLRLYLALHELSEKRKEVTVS